MPNILITGTPGTGKTTLASAVATRSGLQHLELSKLIQEKDLHDGRDEEFDTFIMNDDKVLDYMEDELKIHTARNFIVDFHSSEFFPERWFDLVIVLRVGNDTLFPRLVARGYSEKKVTENITAEIFQVASDEAKESYNADIIKELPSDTIDHMEDNTDAIVEWIANWKPEDSPILNGTYQPRTRDDNMDDD